MKKTLVAFQNYSIRALGGMAGGLFASLIIGLILRQIGDLTGWAQLVRFGQIAQVLMGPAIGVAVAHSLGAPPLAVFATAVAGAIGAGTVSPAMAIGIGEPVGALLASLAGAEIGRRVAGKTRVDIVLVPAAVIIVGGLVGLWIGPGVSAFMRGLGSVINEATHLHPFPMGIALSVLVGMVLTLPISSAALAISLGLSGLAAGAATVGCATQMVGFAVASYKENGLGGLISQGLGTSMLQIPNIIRNPYIWVPPTLASAILGPISTVIFRMENIPTGAGMGTSGLVGQFGTIEAMGPVWPQILLLHFILPALLTLAISGFMRAKGWIKPGDMKLKL